MLYLTITQDSNNVCIVIQSGPKTLDETTAVPLTKVHTSSQGTFYTMAVGPTLHLHSTSE